MPLDFYRAGEVVDSTTGKPTGQTFPERMAGYGFLEDSGADLPVGFGTVTLDFLNDLEGLSINCAACHVGEIHSTGPSGTVRLRMIGGPNLCDMRRFSQDTYVSLRRALLHPGQLLRLLVRTGRLQPETVAALAEWKLIENGKFAYRAESLEAEAFLQTIAAVAQPSGNDASPPAFRFATNGRSPWENERHAAEPEFLLVALPHPRRRVLLKPAPVRTATPVAIDVLRNVALLTAEANYFLSQGRFPLTTREGPGRLDAFATIRFLLYPAESIRFPFTAPVSVPHLWGTGRKKWLHWNSNTNSTMQRNIAQSLGMGALAAHGGVNNVLMPNLLPLETAAEQTTAPKWPTAVLGPLNNDLVQRGEQLYDARCAKCHDAGKVDPATGLIEYLLFTLHETGTDPTYALNFHRPVGSKPFPQALADSTRSLQTWYYQKRDPQHPVPAATQLEWEGGESRQPAVWRDPLAASVDAPVYAGLPLNGVWATAPYLHNNSVPTLRDLLKPAAQRPVVFRVGHRDYDPVNVGYTQPKDPGAIPVLERFDTHDAGNSNAGHDGPGFGAEGLSSEDIDALLEYLKTL